MTDSSEDEAISARLVGLESFTCFKDRKVDDAKVIYHHSTA